MIYTYKRKGTLTVSSIKKRTNRFIISLTAALLIGGIVVAGCLTAICLNNQNNKHNEVKQKMKGTQRLYEAMEEHNYNLAMYEAELNDRKNSMQAGETKWIVFAVIAVAALMLFKKRKS